MPDAWITNDSLDWMLRLLMFLLVGCLDYCLGRNAWISKVSLRRMLVLRFMFVFFKLDAFIMNASLDWMLGVVVFLYRNRNRS